MRPQRFSCGIFSAPRVQPMKESGFNEAAAFQLRNRRRKEGLRAMRWASMRPQRFSCGIQHHATSGRSICSRFNEAAAFQLRNQSPIHKRCTSGCRLQ